MIARLLVSACLLVALACAAPAGAGSEGATPPEGRPVDVFADLDGTWRGEFVGYDVSGREQFRIQVTQVYATIDAETQTVKVEDRMSDGTVIHATGRNTARRAADGRLELRCVVEKSNGEVSDHRGRQIDLPGGLHGLVWYSADDSKTETFVESVAREGDDLVYRIQGTGTYDGTTIVMTGRYVKQPD